MNGELRIERFDSRRHAGLVEPLTELLHLAYKPLADAGMNFLATHQDSRVTRKRLDRGESYLAFWQDELAGVISLHPYLSDSSCSYYRREAVFHFGQFAVRPDLQGQGIGNSLMELVETRAKEKGGRELALDTSEQALALIEKYERHGYARVGMVQWEHTNFKSVVMSKQL
jgi:GNAT superfamily N-acetyltransferase